MFVVTDKYTRQLVHVTQPYIGTTADNQLAPPRQKSYQGMAPKEKLSWQWTC